MLSDLELPAGRGDRIVHAYAALREGLGSRWAAERVKNRKDLVQRMRGLNQDLQAAASRRDASEVMQAVDQAFHRGSGCGPARGSAA